MSVKRTPLTQGQWDRLGLVGWTIDEVPSKYWRIIPGLKRLQDTFGIMASGSITNSGMLNGINAVAGIDVLVQEPRPRPNEPPGNAYHYVIQKIADERYRFLLHGPFRGETVVDHWFDAPQLDPYWADWDKPLIPEAEEDAGVETEGR
jgi:hypothetical protein